MEESAEIKIKEAARKIFLVKGYDGARMQEIADQAGANKAMLNYYFRSKKALFQLVFFEEFAKLFQNMVKILMNTNSFEEKINEFVDTEIAHLLEVPQLPLFIANEMNKNSGLMQERFKSIAIGDIFQIVEKQYQAEVKEGKLRDIPFVQFLMNLQSLCIFPIIAKPIFMQITKSSNQQYIDLINQRKQIIKDFIISYMIIK